MIDDLTRYLVAVPLKKMDAITVSDALINNFILIYGTPKTILTDMGTNFISQIFLNICKLFKIKKLNCSAYHPETNGVLERYHRNLKTYLRMFVEEKGTTNWCKLISYATFSYNTQIHSSINFTPFELVFGKIANIPICTNIQGLSEYCYDDYAIYLKELLKNIRSIAKANVLNSKETTKNFTIKMQKLYNFKLENLY